MPTTPTATPGAAGVAPAAGAEAPAAASAPAGGPAPVPTVRVAPVRPVGGPAYLHRSLASVGGPQVVGRTLVLTPDDEADKPCR